MIHRRFSGTIPFGKLISTPELAWMWLIRRGSPTDLYNRFLAIQDVTGRLNLLVL